MALISAHKAEAAERARKAGAPRFLGEIALHNPHLAWTLLQAAREQKGYRLAGGYVVTETGGWEMISIKGRFDALTADQHITARLLGTIEADIWVRRVTYTVRRPNFAAGSPFKGFFDYFNRLNPNIDFELIVQSFCPYLISPEPTPLENIENVFECVCPAGLILKCSATFEAFFTNLRALSSDENPTEAIVTFSGTRLPKGLYGGCDWSTLVADLVAAGAMTEAGGCAPCGP